MFLLVLFTGTGAWGAMTKAEREMMERIHAYGIILSLDEEQAGLVLARIKKMLAEQEAEAKLLTGKEVST